MPTYVYACRDCDDRLEVVQKMSDEPLKECPSCSGSLRRVLFLLLLLPAPAIAAGATSARSDGAARQLWFNKVFQVVAPVTETATEREWQVNLVQQFVSGHEAIEEMPGIAVVKSRTES